MYFIVVFWHILHKMETSTYQGSNLQSLLTKPYILLCLFFLKIIFSFIPRLLARRSQEQALGPPKLR